VLRGIASGTALAGAVLVATAARPAAHEIRVVPNAFAAGSDASTRVPGHVPIAPATLGSGAPTQRRSDSADAAATVERFHAALAAGDSAGALALLTPDVVILESGGVETREDYRAHHLPADIAFARAVKGERAPLRVTVRGDAAWATGTSTTVGEYRGRPVNSSGAELVVLTRTPQGWRIAAIHWSSRARRPAGGG